jgi:uncharacterized protein
MSQMRRINSFDTPEGDKSARQELSKPIVLEEDVNLDYYATSAEEKPYQDDPSQLPVDTKEKMLGVGVDLDDVEERSGTFIQEDNAPVHCSVSQEGIEVMAVSEALEKYDWLADYWWHAVKSDADRYTASVARNQNNGYFIRVLPGYKITFPFQACLYLTTAQLSQNVHNVIIAEEGSELNLITGCASSFAEGAGLHLGISEFYVKKGAKITSTMIHNWNPEIDVRPRSAAVVQEDGLFLSNYVLMNPIHSLQMDPVARCEGENAVVRYNSILVATPGSFMDVGSRTILNARGAKTEIISRAITAGGNIVSRGYIEGNAPDVKGHLECRGLILKGEGSVHAIPELKGNLAGIDLSHEAAVGKIAEEEVEYLMARGLSRNEATATIVRGFLRVDIEGLPAALNKEIEKVVQSSEEDIL